jgi:hypothetical protein
VCCMLAPVPTQLTGPCTAACCTAGAWLRGALGGSMAEEELRGLLQRCPGLFIVEGGTGRPLNVATAEDRVLQVRHCSCTCFCHQASHLAQERGVVYTCKPGCHSCTATQYRKSTNTNANCQPQCSGIKYCISS